MQETSFQSGLKIITEKSQLVYQLRNNNHLLLEHLKNLPKEILEGMINKYKNSTGAVNAVRYEIAEDIRSKTLTLDRLENYYNANKGNFGPYKDLYSLIYTFIIDHDNGEIKAFLSQLANDLQIDLQIVNETKISKICTFAGARNIGSEHSWFALYNKGHVNQQKAKQLFFSVYNGKVEYSLYDRRADRHSMEPVLPENVTYQNILDSFQIEKQEILKDVPIIVEPLKVTVDEIIENLKKNKIKAWLAKPGVNGFLWAKCLENEGFYLGWGEVIRELQGRTDFKDSDVIDLLNKHYPSHTQNPFNSKRAIIDFIKGIKKGDILISCKGTTKLLGLGIANGELGYDEDEEEYYGYKEVDWFYQNDSESPFQLPLKTLTSLDNNLAIKVIEKMVGREIDIIEKPFDDEYDTSDIPLNQILYGPPGTGKTYTTIEKALKIVARKEYETIINKKDSPEIERHHIKTLFKKYCRLGQIEFCTFHQSMSYEDFIEGIKPFVDEDDDGKKTVFYDIEDGLFKKLAIKASYQFMAAIEPKREDLKSEEWKFDELWEALLDSFETSIKNDEPIVLDTRVGFINVVEISDKGNISLKHDLSGITSYTVSYQRLKILYHGIESKEKLGSISNLNKSIRTIIGGCNASAYYAVLGRLFDMKPLNLPKEPIEHIRPIYQEQKEIVENSGYGLIQNIGNERILVENYVLIIDEINRGNVSQIFGELITLLEDNKRLDKPEALTIKLPYSKSNFGVPSNLYLIGTMNTADRSVEALDTALRRRFSFVEMPSKPELLIGEQELLGVNLIGLLTTYNDRIEALLNIDHHLGHAYFMNIDTIEKLKAVYTDKIIPLLKEYFYGDDGKIGLVLGEGFFESQKMNSNPNNIFAKFFNYDKDQLNHRDRYKLKDLTLMSNHEFLNVINDVKLPIPEQEILAQNIVDL